MIDNVLIGGLIFMGIAFLSGSIPFGLLYALVRGVDIRKTGSGNIGATNVARQFGFLQGFLPILILDATKAIVPIVLFRTFVSNDQSMLFEIVEVAIGIFVVLGHMFSPWLGFKGGKGVASSFGMVVALAPITALIELVIFLVLFFTIGKKIVGRCSVIAGIAFPFVAYFDPETTIPFQIMAILVSIMVIVSHKKNIKNWISGEDLRQKESK